MIRVLQTCNFAASNHDYAWNLRGNNHGLLEKQTYMAAVIVHEMMAIMEFNFNQNSWAKLGLMRIECFVFQCMQILMQ